MRRWLTRLVLIVTGLLAGSLIGEVVARVFGLGGTTIVRGSLHAFDPDVGWVCEPACDTLFEAPGSFRVRILCNADGMRDRDHQEAKPEGTRRIAVLGDSFMWGYGVENDEMFSARLEGELSDFECLNFGTNGYGTVQELIRLERDALPYQPDWCLVAFCWNDLEDNFDEKKGGRPRLTEIDDNSFEIENRPVRRKWKAGPIQWLRKNSRLWGFLEYARALWSMRLSMAERASNPSATRGKYARNDDVQAMSFSLIDLYASPTPAIDRAYRGVEHLLGRMHRLITARDSKLMVVYVAEKDVRSQEAFEENLLRPYGGEENENELDWDRPARRLSEMCSRLGVPFLDLNSDFRAATTPDALFLRGNNHWSAAGHEVAARAVAAKIHSLRSP